MAGQRAPALPAEAAAVRRVHGRTARSTFPRRGCSRLPWSWPDGARGGRRLRPSPIRERPPSQSLFPSRPPPPSAMKLARRRDQLSPPRLHRSRSSPHRGRRRPPCNTDGRRARDLSAEAADRRRTHDASVGISPPSNHPPKKREGTIRRTQGAIISPGSCLLFVRRSPRRAATQTRIASTPSEPPLRARSLLELSLIFFNRAGDRCENECARMLNRGGKAERNRKNA